MSEKEFLSQLKAHQHIIYKLVHLYAQSDADKKDMYQEIVLQSWKTYPAFRGDAKFSTWLYRVCLNTIFTLNRKVSRVQYGDLPERAAPGRNEEVDRLYSAIRTLPETERAVISLHLEGYDNREIADMIGITANLVGVKIHRIRQQLSTLLKK